MRGLALVILTISALAGSSLEARAQGEAVGLEARVWLDRGDEPVLRRGETVRIFYRTTQDAYAAIFRLDTDGRISLVYPPEPSMIERLTGGVDYRLIFPSSPVWRVRDDPGVGYFFMVASPNPLDFSAFPFDPEFGWDLGAVGNVVYEDPYVAIDEYVAQLIPGWEEVPYGLDFISYSVGDTYTYPRFLCYDCHDARPYASWNPYAVPCTTYRVVIYDDPYFYPYYRYSGMAVVVARPLVTQPRYAFSARSVGDSYRPIIRTREAPPRRSSAQYRESPRATEPASPRALTPQRGPSGRPTLQRRPSAPSSRLPVRTPPSASGNRSAPNATIVRPSRPSTSSPSSTPRTRARPSERVAPTPTRRPGGDAEHEALGHEPPERPPRDTQSTEHPVQSTEPAVRPPGYEPSSGWQPGARSIDSTESTEHAFPGAIRGWSTLRGPSGEPALVRPQPALGEAGHAITVLRVSAADGIA